MTGTTTEEIHVSRRLATVLGAVLLAAACSTDEPPTGSVSSAAPTASDATPERAPTTSTTEAAAQQHPDVLDAMLEPSGDGWRVSATISSPYDSPDRYADAFRVLAPDGTVLGVRELLHDHAGEQPFTRSLDDVEIPDGVGRVTVEGRDQANGWGGATVTVDVPR